METIARFVLELVSAGAATATSESRPYDCNAGLLLNTLLNDSIVYRNPSIGEFVRHGGLVCPAMFLLTTLLEISGYKGATTTTNTAVATATATATAGITNTHTRTTKHNSLSNNSEYDNSDPLCTDPSSLDQLASVNVDVAAATLQFVCLGRPCNLWQPAQEFCEPHYAAYIACNGVADRNAGGVEEQLACLVMELCNINPINEGKGPNEKTHVTKEEEGEGQEEGQVGSVTSKDKPFDQEGTIPYQLALGLHTIDDTEGMNDLYDNSSDAGDCDDGGDDETVFPELIPVDESGKELDLINRKHLIGGGALRQGGISSVLASDKVASKDKKISSSKKDQRKLAD
jgi:hypothetical protein